MRKIALLTMPLLVLGLFSLSADEMEMMGPEVNSPVKVEVSGEATLTWGIDLETNATGFRSTNKSDLKVTIVPKQTKTRPDGGMDSMDTDDLYAYIELKDFQWEVTSADGQGKTSKPSVTAKLIMGAFSIQTFSSPSVKVDYVDPNDKDKADGKDEDEFPGADFHDVGTEYGGEGLTVAYKLDPVELSLGVVSENDWTESKPDPADKDVAECHTHEPNDDGVMVIKKCPNEDKDDQNDENAYAFIGTINLDIGEDAELEAKVAYAHEYMTGGIITPKSVNNDEIGVGAKATFDLGDIEPYVAFDTSVGSEGTNLPFDVGGGLKWIVSADEKSHFKTDLMMYSPADGESKMYVAASLVEADGDDGALEGMGATLTIGLDDAAGAGDWNARLKASYLVNNIKPYFDVSFGSAAGAKTAFKAGLDLTMVEHLTAKVEYASKDVGGDEGKGEVTTALTIKY